MTSPVSTDCSIATAFRSARSPPRTGQSQSEISEIIARGRKVHSYELLVRIAEGLDVPRGWMGLEYDESSLPYLASGGDS